LPKLCRKYDLEVFVSIEIGRLWPFTIDDIVDVIRRSRKGLFSWQAGISKDVEADGQYLGTTAPGLPWLFLGLWEKCLDAASHYGGFRDTCMKRLWLSCFSLPTNKAAMAW